MSKLGFVKPSS